MMGPGGGLVAMPEEEARRQAAAREEGPGPYRGFDPFVQYLLHRLDAMEARLEAKIDKLDAKIDSKADALHQELHNTTRWIIGTVITAAGVAVALVQLLK